MYSNTLSIVRGVEPNLSIVLGPGSWFTSVMPHLLVPELGEALRVTRARRLVILNLEMQTTETDGLTAAAHLDVFARYAPDVRIDVVLADPDAVDDVASVREAAARIGAELVLAPMAARDRPGTHDRLRLAAALQDIMAESQAAPGGMAG